MLFGYHSVPSELRGNHLVPLNGQRELWPDLFLRYSEKYFYRTSIMKNVIPRLDCLWNDVIHMSLVHPGVLRSIIAEEYVAMDGKVTLAALEQSRMFFEIPTERLDAQKLVVYDAAVRSLDNTEYTADKQAVVPPPAMEQILAFGDLLANEMLVNLTEKLERYREYVRFEIGNGRRPLMYVGIPHLLFLGRIDLASVPTVDWL